MRALLLRLVLVASLLAGAGHAMATGGRLGLVPDDDTSRVWQPHRRPVFQFDNRYSILTHRLVGIYGLKLGLEWRGRWRAGAGGYLMSSGIPAVRPVPAELPTGSVAEDRLRYVVGFGEYVLVGTPRWEVSLPLQVGVGTHFSRYILPDGSRTNSEKTVIWLLEPSVSSHVRAFRWFAVGAGLGWRQPVFVSGELQRELNGPIFYGRAKLFLGDLYKVVRGRQRLFSQQGLDQPYGN
ncbi:hypothetical protein LJY25_09885 [Hymenobacter sp. BT175]|uniref:hypothetical protein n=1 Tax=Hymenobacter translucens TaxID=2886507 RepID=UPI001D0E649C|nr:hypothetical protein [Hymenobacter translucens]MCC2546752.1 hypothetical protein [Hymenobacter translucens]